MMVLAWKNDEIHRVILAGDQVLLLAVVWFLDVGNPRVTSG